MKRNRENSAFDDPDLIQLYRATGKTKYLGMLYSRYADFTLAVCMKYLKNSEESKDATMDIFEKLAGDLKQQEIQHFKSWLYAVVRNHCLMILRNSKTKQKHWQDIQKEQEYFMETETVSHQIYEDNMVNNTDIIEKAILELNEEQNQCIRLFFYENKSYQEIVKMTGYNIKQVKSYLQNGKRNLQKMLQQFHEKKKEN